MLRYLLKKSLDWLFMIVVATNLTYFLANFFLDPRANYLQLCTWTTRQVTTRKNTDIGMPCSAQGNPAVRFAISGRHPAGG